MIDIILTYYSTDFLLDKCISQLLQTSFMNFKIHIVDNTLSSRKALLRFSDPRINIIQGPPCRTSSEHSRGKQHPKGIVHGISQTNGEYIVLTEADCWPLTPDWLDYCIDKLENGISLVGLQDPGSLPITFQVYKRCKLADYPSFSYLRKPAYCPEDLAYITNPEVICNIRHKWRYGEYLPVLMHKNKEKTFGFIPAKACAPWKITSTCWKDILNQSLGVIYGDTIFHCNKSFRKADMIKDNLDFFMSDEYLDTAITPKENNQIGIINNGKYDNSVHI